MAKQATVGSRAGKGQGPQGIAGAVSKLLEGVGEIRTLQHCSPVAGPAEGRSGAKAHIESAKRHTRGCDSDSRRQGAEAPVSCYP